MFSTIENNLKRADNSVHITDVVSIFGSRRNRKLKFNAVPRTMQNQEWQPIKTAVYQDFDFCVVRASLLKNGRLIGTAPDYFFLDDYNRISFGQAEKPCKVYNIHIVLYQKNIMIKNSPAMVISYQTGKTKGSSKRKAENCTD